MRWQHPTLGQVPPADFITLAEHTELIGPLTQFVLTQATIDAHAVDRFNMRLSINVSARNLQDRRFPASVLKALDEVELDPARLELEITESAIASEPERSLFAITAMREAGVRVAIDDFGTGYSSFSMLRDLSVDRLKIDAGFVRGIVHSERQQHLVKVDRLARQGTWRSKPSPRASRPRRRGSRWPTSAATSPRVTSSAVPSRFPSWSNGSTSANRCPHWSTLSS